MENKEVKFVCDEMNGDLARWLRIMGFDCLYLTGKNLDDKLLKICKEEDRILITADKELYKRAISLGLQSILTIENTKEKKLRKIIKHYKLEKYICRVYRCSLCNTKLIKVKTKEIQMELPRYVIEKFLYVWYCPKCNKVYWEGSHWHNITRFLRKVLR